jgi:GTP-binding protein Era
MVSEHENSTAHFRSGFVGIVGKPNIGKSTLLNGLLGKKVSIVSPKPQTTRNRILGILTNPGAQIIFIDVPGIHKPSEKLHKIMVKTATSALEEADCILYLVPPSLPDRSETFITGILKKYAKPVVLCINKIDLIKKNAILPLIDAYQQLHEFEHIVPISALYGNNTGKLVNLLISMLPEGPLLFPGDQITDGSETFRISELIREKVFLHTHQEIPYSVGVVIEEMQENTHRKITTVHASVLVERSTHKGIIIGKQGTKLKLIGKDARIEIEALLGMKVFLDLRVKCMPNWKENPFMLKKMGLIA